MNGDKQPEPCVDAISRKDALFAVRVGMLSTATVYGRSEAGMYARREIESALKNLPPVNVPDNNVGEMVNKQAVLEKAYDISEIDGEHFTEPRMVVDIDDIQKLPLVKPQEPKAGQFAEWVAEEIFDDNWEYNKDAFAELACRKLEKLGIVRAKGDEWELVEPQDRQKSEG